MGYPPQGQTSTKHTGFEYINASIVIWCSYFDSHNSRSKTELIDMKKTKLEIMLINGYILVMCNPSSRLEDFARHQPKGQPKFVLFASSKNG